jgi:1,4-dihydroxy-2-naphthoate octaprenyltransferase
MPNLTTKLKNIVIYGGHFTALSSPSIILSVIILMNLNITILDLLIAYLIPLIVYSYDYNKEKETDYISDPDKTKFFRMGNHNYITIIYIILLLVLLIILNKPNFLIFVAILVFGGLLYSIVFKVLTKIIPGFKSIFITLIWAYAGTFFMIFLNDLTYGAIFIFIFAYIYMKGFINVVFFDFKDIASDKTKGLKTIPVLIGKKNSVLILSAINLIALFMIIYCVYINVLPSYAISLVVFTLYTFIYLFKGLNANEKELLNYTYIMADAEFILWPIVLIISKTLLNL